MPEIPEVDYKALVAENKAQALKLIELNDLKDDFLRVVTKLGIICSKFGIDARLPETSTQPFFSFAVDERLKREGMVRQELKTAQEKIAALPEAEKFAAEISQFYGGNGLSMNQAREATAERLKLLGLK